MSSEYQGKSNLDIATEAERDLNSYGAKTGNRDMSSSSEHSKSLWLTLLTFRPSAVESGVDESAANKFAGGDVMYGSAASGAGNNREIPLSEGGSLDPRTGK